VKINHDRVLHKQRNRIERMFGRMKINRARAMLLTGKGMTAQEAKDYGIVHEILPRDEVLDRAKAIARDLLKLASVTLRLQRLLMLQNVKKLALDQLSQGLMIEGMTILQKYVACHVPQVILRRALAPHRSQLN
jgi:enoyl-CoA hydratase/carnithine racemase